MATINLTIPDAQLPRIIAALCSFDQITPLAPTGANAKSVVAKWVTNVVVAYEQRLAHAALIPIDTTGLVT